METFSAETPTRSADGGAKPWLYDSRHPDACAQHSLKWPGKAWPFVLKTFSSHEYRDRRKSPGCAAAVR
jgi:hypothetical protein